MKRRVIVTINYLIFIMCFSPVHSQQSPRNERNSGGVLVNQDYFSAMEYSDVRDLLKLVEQYHLNDRVMRDFASGRYSNVIWDLKYTLDKFPNHPKALQLLVAVAKLTKQPSLPLPYFQNALRLYSQHALTHAQYGAFLVDRGLAVEGIGKLKQAVEMDPKLVAAYVSLARVYYRTGHSDLARESEQRARELGYTGRITPETGKE